jgi:ABC-type multidrug transport system ATPase subunit
VATCIKIITIPWIWQVSGSITYCGHTFSEFYPERTSAYVSQYDLHNAEMTVRETLDFSRRCLGVGARYDMLAELAKREREAGIKPDPEIDAYMKATAVQGKESNIVTDLTLKVRFLTLLFTNKIVLMESNKKNHSFRSLGLTFVLIP